MVDDASPDDIASIVESFHDPRIVYRRNSVNIGARNLAAAWNRAMEFAGGEWCILASDDDIYHPAYLETMLALARKHPSCDLFHCRFAQIDPAGVTTRLGSVHLEFSTQAQFAYSKNVLHLASVASEFMFRRAAFVRTGGFVEFPLAWHSDDATWLNLAERGMAWTPEILFSFRQSGANISSRNDMSVIAKHRASEEYRVWLAAKLAEIAPESEADARALELLRTTSAADRLIDNTEYLILSYIHSPLVFLRVLWQYPAPRRVKFRAILKRLACMKP